MITLIATPIATAMTGDGQVVALTWAEIDGMHPDPDVRRRRPGRWATLPNGDLLVCLDPKPEARGSVVSSCPVPRSSR